MRFYLIPCLGLLLLLAACQVDRPPRLSTPTAETLPMGSVQITAFHPDKATYQPGAPVEFLITLTSPLTRSLSMDVTASVKYLTEEVAALAQPVELPPGGQQTVRLTWSPPPDAPRGYGVDLSVCDTSGQTLAVGHTAFDVLTSWTQAPRYGFLTDFAPGRSNIDETMAWLVRYHLNGLQFYDWMYRHDQFLTDHEPYLDPLDRRLSRATVENLIAAAHKRNIAAMPYTAIYAASIPFYEAHPDWALYQANGQPYLLGENFLVYMDPRPDSPWVNHLLEQFDQVLQQMDFDGIHLDQYGDPKQGYDSQGQRFNLADPLAATINATKELVRSHRPQGVVVFNAVNNWPIETVVSSDQNFIYIEVWPPHTLYRDLWELIANAQELGQGKPVVLAAYIDPARSRNARLADAVIFASGGYHIELGEPGGMLADPYFPNYGLMSDELAEVIRRYYDFAVRYENVLALGTHDATSIYESQVTIEGVNTDAKRAYNKVWPIVREGDDVISLSLINLLDIVSPEWNGLLLADPTPLDELRVRYRTKQNVQRVWFVSPDFASPQATFLDFEPGQDSQGSYVEFTIPRLEYWDLIVIELAV
jgi:dextranase